MWAMFDMFLKKLNNIDLIAIFLHINIVMLQVGITILYVNIFISHFRNAYIRDHRENIARGCQARICRSNEKQTAGFNANLIMIWRLN